MHSVIQSINEVLDGIFKPGAKVHFYGLAESVAARDSKGEKVVPAIVLPDGECFDVYGLADMKDATFYHRLQSSQFGSVQSFGSTKDYEKTSDVSLIVFGKRQVYDQFVLADTVCAALGKIKNVTLQGVDYNLLQVFATEYSGLSCFLNPDYFLFRINYRITSTFNRCTNIEKL